ncbi:unnamed protein product [Amoebophrya sp. A120]|nr:unnamed protein product [Amoebophrya sp. A120]|eukprot:GSA120T00006623001.1
MKMISVKLFFNFILSGSSILLSRVDCALISPKSKREPYRYRAVLEEQIPLANAGALAEALEAGLQIAVGKLPRPREHDDLRTWPRAADDEAVLDFTQTWDQGLRQAVFQRIRDATRNHFRAGGQKYRVLDGSSDEQQRLIIRANHAPVLVQQKQKGSLDLSPALFAPGVRGYGWHSVWLGFHEPDRDIPPTVRAVKAGDIEHQHLDFESFAFQRRPRSSPAGRSRRSVQQDAKGNSVKIQDRFFPRRYGGRNIPVPLFPEEEEEDVLDRYLQVDHYESVPKASSAARLRNLVHAERDRGVDLVDSRAGATAVRGPGTGTSTSNTTKSVVGQSGAGIDEKLSCKEEVVDDLSCSRSLSPPLGRPATATTCSTEDSGTRPGSSCSVTTVGSFSAGSVAGAASTPYVAKPADPFATSVGGAAPATVPVLVLQDEKGTVEREGGAVEMSISAEGKREQQGAGASYRPTTGGYPAAGTSSEGCSALAARRQLVASGGMFLPNHGYKDAHEIQGLSPPRLRIVPFKGGACSALDGSPARGVRATRKGLQFGSAGGASDSEFRGNYKGDGGGSTSTTTDDSTHKYEFVYARLGEAHDRSELVYDEDYESKLLPAIRNLVNQLKQSCKTGVLATLNEEDEVRDQCGFVPYSSQSRSFCPSSALVVTVAHTIREAGPLISSSLYADDCHAEQEPQDDAESLERFLERQEHLIAEGTGGRFPGGAVFLRILPPKDRKRFPCRLRRMFYHVLIATGSESDEIDLGVNKYIANGSLHSENIHRYKTKTIHLEVGAPAGASARATDSVGPCVCDTAAADGALATDGENPKTEESLAKSQTATCGDKK